MDAVIDAVVSRCGSSVLRERGSEVVFNPCPFGECRGDKFAINVETGLWNCPKCGEKGNSWQLVERLGCGPVRSAAPRVRPPQKPRVPQGELDAALVESESALAAATEFLSRRKLTIDTASHFRIGVRMIGDAAHLALPYFRPGGAVAFFKYRSLVGKEFLRLPSRDTMPLPECAPLFNGHRIDTTRPVLVTEGELDAMTLWQMGHDNVASLANGASSIDDSWVLVLATCPVVLAAYDQDEAGERGFAELERRLGKDRVARLRFGPHKDANDALMAGWTPEQFAAAVAEARPTHPDILKSAREIADDLVAKALSGSRPAPVMTGFPTFDQTQRGLRLGEFSILTAHTGEGKTTFLLDLALRLAQEFTPVTFFTLEQRPEDTTAQLMGMLESCAFEDMNQPLMERAARDIPPCFYVAGESLKDRLASVLAAIRYSVVVYGVKVVVIDHLDFLIQPSDGESRYSAASEAVLAIHSAARDHQVHVLLVCQPTTDSGRHRDKDDHRRPIRIEDVAETRQARQLAHNGFTWASNKDTRTGELTVAKARYGPAKEGISIKFSFDGFRFHESGSSTS